MRRLLVSAFLILLLLLAGAVPVAYAVLERVGPINPDPTVGGYPAWYQDTNGLALEFCNPLNQDEVDGGWCLLLAGDVVIPEHFPDNFFDEHFWFAADTGMTLANGGRALLVLAVEAAFAVDVTPGGQITFSRIRVRLDPVPASGVYRFIHPYGENLIEADEGERIFFSDDVGIAPGNFTDALSSRLGPFLLPSNTPGGPELPAVPGPVQGKLYIADPGRSGPVTGSPLPDFIDSTGVSRNHNIFRIEGPAGSGLGGVDPVTNASIDFIETTDFTLMGRIFTGAMPGRVTVDRASYASSAVGNKLDVFATAFPTIQGRIPPNPQQPAVEPVLSFFSAPCDVDTASGALIAPAGQAGVQMFNTGNTFWGQSQPVLIPLQVCVEDETARNADGQVVPVFIQSTVTDQVSITAAAYDPGNGGTLTVTAQSSDELSLPELILAGFNVPPVAGQGQFLVTPLAAPPAQVCVLSSEGGFNNFQVTTGVGITSGGNVPLALNDETTILEDSGTSSINILANDTLNGQPIVFGPDVVATIVTAPRLGTAEINRDGTISYTPDLNTNGTDSLAYSVTVGTSVSNRASVTINITPVNDPPFAVNDSTLAVANVTTTINVLANDIDLDGPVDLVNAVNLTQPTPGGASVTGGFGGPVIFTAAVGGTYTFTYRAQDRVGATSANEATVTVTVIPTETITVQLAMFRTGGRRWRVAGIDSVALGQTLTIAFENGTAAGTVIGTAVVDVAGAWAVDLRGASGLLDPRSTGVTQIRVTSPLGGSAVAMINIRR